MATVPGAPPAPKPAPTPELPARRRAKRKKSPLPRIVGIAALFAIAWFAWVKTHPAVDPYANVLTAKVTRGDLVETVTATGTISAQTGYRINIGAQITGVIKHLYADVGTHVQKNQVIAQLDLPDVQATYQAAIATYQAAIQAYNQQASGVAQTNTQTAQAIAAAKATLQSDIAALGAADANYKQQVVQTPSDIKRAQTAVTAATAALATAKSNLAQTKADTDLELQTARDTVTSATANEVNSKLTLIRNQDLLQKGYVAQSIVDQAQATETANTAAVSSAKQNLGLVQQKVAADLETATDAVTTAEQNLDASKAALQAAQAEVYTTASRQADMNNAAHVVQQGQANLQTALGNIANNTIKSQAVQQAKSQMLAAAENVKVAKAQWDKTFIRSPIKGTVLALSVYEGETVAAGLAAPTLISVANLDKLETDAYVDETDIGKVKLHQTATTSVDAFPKHKFTGHVFKIAAGSTIQSGVVTYDTSITLDNPGHRLLPDMTASATINIGTKHDVLLVPSEAVKQTLHGANVTVITRRRGQISTQVKKVKTGASDGVNTEIREGLKEGEEVVRAGLPTAGGPNRQQSAFGPPGGGGGGGRR
jgi:RND family efflux transporter MFP subunit